MSKWTDDERSKARQINYVVGLALVVVGALLAYFLTLPMIESDRDPTMWGVILAGALPALLMLVGCVALLPDLVPLIKYAMDLVGKDKPHDGEGG